MQRRFIRIIAVFIAAAAAAIRSYADERDSTRHDRIDESVVTSVRESKQLEGVMSGRLRLDGANISGLPKFLGTTDILKTIQLLPGVMASGEMDSGIYIRGGDPGQNLILFDGAKIYAPAHLFGFFSIFNSDHISSATIIKSGLPARYGGCASGIIDIGTSDSTVTKTEDHGRTHRHIRHTAHPHRQEITNHGLRTRDIHELHPQGRGKSDE